MKKTITIEGSSIHDIHSFYQEINRVFMEGEDWKIGDSLDAFDDLLYGGFGALDGDAPVTLEWKDIGISRTTLGMDATREYYQQKLLPGSPFNRVAFTLKLTELNEGRGQTYFDIILEIISRHRNIRLVQG